MSSVSGSTNEKTTSQPLKERLQEKQELTLPVISMAHTPLLVCRVLDEIHEADFVVEIPGKPDSKPFIVTVLNLDDDSKGLLILNTIMKSALEKCIALDPDHKALAGRYFKFTTKDKREDKKYLNIHVVEMEVK